jgi:hypothetical protein
MDQNAPSPQPRANDASSCEVCDHARKHSWFGPKLAPARSHCRHCHRSWASLVEGHCTICCAHFANVKAFDAHLTEDGCRPPAEVIRKDGRPRLTTRTSRYGITWRLAFYGQRPDFAPTDEDDTDDGTGEVDDTQE